MKRPLATAVLALAVLAPLPAGAATPGDPARGEAIYARCQACHALAYNRTGPKHCGLFGRRAGGVADFRYSPAMAHASIVWNGNTLDRFPDQPDCDDSGHDYGLRRHCRCAGTGGPDRLVAPGKCILCRMHAVSHP
ncbi:c-type cytochrome [Aromatoleum toluclasticum]|uniref:c-type cytochrome n=1 Tax=Aromatoleum toluclasticum TaxID=92003 RepID=UPI001E4D6F76|nr:hypothetical protein [Aromatoleum toluclasticum]